MKEWTDEFGVSFREEKDGNIMLERGVDIESYTIPNSVTWIGEGAIPVWTRVIRL